ncbi:MAG: hypothetical protein KGI04_00935 [Candidatus Micrarchaeota archaeon]|nr:hypothetical protein [Candidatus Micrarchaeota archaeon]
MIGVRTARIRHGTDKQTDSELAAYLRKSPQDEREPSGAGHIVHDYQLTYLYRSQRGVMAEFSNNKVKISIPSIIDNYGNNLVLDGVVTLNVLVLHELSHWADGKDYGDDTQHSPEWNQILLGALTGLTP